MKLLSKLAFGVAAVAFGALGAAVANSQDMPFGTPVDTDYAAKVWSAMGAMNMTGPDAMRAFPYEGVEPHGFVLETFYTKATIDGHTGDLVIKRNYGPSGVTIEEVQADAYAQLDAITVMFKREAGYDADNKDWFWAKFLKGGALDKNPKGMELAGRVAKGADTGCIACHVAAPGDDYLFSTDNIK